MEKEKIAKINYYAHEQKVRELTPDEKAEQHALRMEYVAEIRASFGSQLEHTVVQYPDGTKKNLTEVAKKKKD